MLTVYFNFNLCYIAQKNGNPNKDSVMKKLKKLMDLPRATGETGLGMILSPTQIKKKEV